jgi:hypothetical protein
MTARFNLPRPMRKHQTTQTALEFGTELCDLAPIELEVLTSAASQSAREVR